MKTENMETTPETQTIYDTPDPLSATRNGKIAALPRDLREALNRRMRKEYQSDDILDWLNAEPAVMAVMEKKFEGKAITRQNLSEWRHGGYMEWERHQAAHARLEQKRKAAGDKGIGPNQFGQEIAGLYAEEVTVTLDELMTTAANAEVRWHRLDKGLQRIEGWRRSDYHAERMALDKAKWVRHCEREEEQAEREEYEKECKRMCASLIRQSQRQGKPPGLADLLLNSMYDLDLLHALQCRLDRMDEEWREAGPVENGNGKGVKHGESEVVEPQGSSDPVAPRRTRKNKGGKKENIQQPTSNIQQPVAEGTQSEAPTTKLQAPSTLNHQPSTSQCLTPDTSHVTPPTNLQPATKEPSDEGSLTVAQAEKVVSAWKAKAKTFGANLINQWDVAELEAYLSGQPTKWYSLKIHDFEIKHPPLRDPRHNPASPWCRFWKNLQQEIRANEKN